MSTINNPFLYSHCTACQSEYVFLLRHVGTSRTKLDIPLLCCLDCRTMTCIGDYVEDEQQLISDVEYNIAPDLLRSKYSSFKDLLNMLAVYINRDSRENIKNYIIGELGCNVGVFIKACRDFGIKQCIGYDINKFAIAKGKELYPDIDIRDTLFGVDQTIFDLTLAIDVFEHLRNPRDVMQSMISKMKKGGYIYITVPRIDNALWPFLKHSCDEMKSFNMSSPFRDNDVHIVHFSIDGLQKLGVTCGLRVVKDFVDQNNLDNKWPMNGVLFKK